jgi:threonine dehydrogenase-like Zn-dependent dehydrogenase
VTESHEVAFRVAGVEKYYPGVKALDGVDLEGYAGELDVLGAHLGQHCWPAAAAMLDSGRLPLDEIVTHQLPLSELQAGLDLLADGTASIKVTLPQ